MMVMPSVSPACVEGDTTSSETAENDSGRATRGHCEVAAILLHTVAKYAPASACQPPSALSVIRSSVAPVPSPPMKPWYLLRLRGRW